MRGEGSPAPIWEGEDGVIAWLLVGPRAHLPGAAARAGRAQARHPGQLHQGALGGVPEPGADRPGPPDARAHRRPRPDRDDRAAHQPPHPRRDRHRLRRPAEVRPGCLARDAGPLGDVHLRGRAAGRHAGITSGPTPPSGRTGPTPIELWHKISTVEDPEWTRRYHSNDPAEKAFGARAEVTLKSGEVIADELAVADAHPLGARPFEREQYVGKFTELADGVVDRRRAAAVPARRRRPCRAEGRRPGRAERRGADPQVLDKAPTIPSGIFR